MAFIAAEVVNVLLNPVQSRTLVFEAIVHTTPSSHFSSGKESVWTNAVIEVDNDNVHVTCLDETRAVVVGIAVSVEAATLDEEEHGQL